MARLTLVYFAWVRERVGQDGETMDHPGADATIADVIGMLAVRGEGHAAAFADLTRIRAALDQCFAPLDTPLGDARELALFPPVTGG
jgi:molybdopterin synthase sulfur carrier subunit